jgi:hypothetical protein
MSGKENCFDNALVDTFFKTLKAELAWRTIFQSRIEAASAIGRYIDSFYNPVRRHSASTSSARFSSKGGQRKIENALHFPKGKSMCAMPDSNVADPIRESAHAEFPRGLLDLCTPRLRGNSSSSDLQDLDTNQASRQFGKELQQH